MVDECCRKKKAIYKNNNLFVEEIRKYIKTCKKV